MTICFESAFPSAVRASVREGANLLAISTSDGWTDRATAGHQHAAFAALRAVENRRSVARAAATGVSQLIDPHGRVLAMVPMFEQGILLHDLPLREDLTFYSRWGDWPVGLAWLILFLALVVVVRSRPAVPRRDVDRRP
jgi:apolipoprotein N-acyltransferase